MRVEIGKALSAAREVFGENDYGFGKWLKQRLPFLSRNSAWRFLSVYQRFGFSESLTHNEREIISNLLHTVLFELAVPSTPESAVVEIISRVQGGSLLSRTCPGTGRMPYFIQLSHAWKHAKRL